MWIGNGERNGPSFPNEIFRGPNLFNLLRLILIYSLDWFAGENLNRKPMVKKHINLFYRNEQWRHLNWRSQTEKGTLSETNAVCGKSRLFWSNPHTHCPVCRINAWHFVASYINVSVYLPEIQKRNPKTYLGQF